MRPRSASDEPPALDRQRPLFAESQADAAGKNRTLVGQRHVGETLGQYKPEAQASEFRVTHSLACASGLYSLLSGAVQLVIIIRP